MITGERINLTEINEFDALWVEKVKAVHAIHRAVLAGPDAKAEAVAARRAAEQRVVDWILQASSETRFNVRGAPKAFGTDDGTSREMWPTHRNEVDMRQCRVGIAESEGPEGPVIDLEVVPPYSDTTFYVLPLDRVHSFSVAVREMHPGAAA